MTERQILKLREAHALVRELHPGWHPIYYEMPMNSVGIVLVLSS
jgi:hypothetical protein